MAKTAMNWLLEDNQPSIRYLALTQLLEKPEDDPDIKSAKEMIPKRGWAADILAEQKPGGWWVTKESLYCPMYNSKYWMLIILSDFGLTKDHPKLRNSS